MSSATPPPVVSMLAWWDPKDRKIVFNPDSIVPGVLFLGGNYISFVTPDTTVFECLLDERPPSLRGFFQALTCAFRITCDGITYRLYLYPPQGAPKLTKDHLEGIGATLHVTSYAGALIGGSVASFSSVAGLVGDTAEAISSTGDLVRARRHYKLIQQRVASYGQDHVQ